MILCITPNPAIDRTLILDRLAPAEVQRAKQVIIAAGGKGVNVARSIHLLGGDSLCMGFLGGHAGRQLADLAHSEGLNSSWTWISQETRTCVILVVSNGDATVINEGGPSVAPSDWSRLQSDVRQMMASTKIVCSSGSLPPGSSPEDFDRVLSMLVEAGKQVWVDSSGAALTTALSHPGICVKVNGDELGAILGFEGRDLDSVKRALIGLGEQGLPASVITVGSAGALLATEDGRWHAQGPQVHVASTVGSGDAFLAGLVSGLDIGKDWAEALCDAVAAGTANALSAGGGQFSFREFQEIRQQVQVRAW